MRKHKYEIFLIAGLLIGFSVLLYPSFSSFVNQIGASYAVRNYDNTLNEAGQEQIDSMLSQAQAYNEGLAYGGSEYVSGDPQDPEYASLLNINGDGMIGYISIRKLGVLLPIYHGTSDTTLAGSTGHLEGSSLPVGGESTHAVITGHRGLPTARLFTNLDKLEIGDTFTITVLNEILTYQVDEIDTVLPEETDLLDIVPGQDLVTLVTCTPYAVNTHRLLVRGHRIPTIEEKRVTADADQYDSVLVAFAAASPFLAAALIRCLMYRRELKMTENAGGDARETDNIGTDEMKPERKPDDKE